MAHGIQVKFARFFHKSWLYHFISFLAALDIESSFNFFMMRFFFVLLGILFISSCQAPIGTVSLESYDQGLTMVDTFSIYDPATGITSNVIWSVSEAKILLDDRPNTSGLESRGVTIPGQRVGDVTGGPTGRRIKCIVDPSSICGILATY